MFNTLLVYSLLVTLTNGQGITCPSRGKTGKSLPNIFSLVPNQGGFHAHAEIIGGDHYFTEIEETFNDASKVGIIKFNDIRGFKREEIHYYLVTEEVSFIHQNDLCSTLKLDSEEKLKVIGRWLKSDQLLDQVKSLGPFESLGPVALIDQASRADQIQYVGRESLDGITASHYFFCVQDIGAYIDLYYDEKEKTPFRLKMQFPAQKTLNITINYIYFEPLIPKSDEAITYPWGLGCERLSNPAVPVPQFFKGFDPLLLEMEAALFFTDPYRSSLMSGQIFRLQGVYSYELSEANTTIRIIHDPELLLDWVIDPYTGSCRETEVDMAATSYSTYLRWPYSSTEKFNLLDDEILEPGPNAHSMGQIDFEFGRMDIFEKTVEAFFQAGEYGEYFDAVVTYFFPVKDHSNVRFQAPSKIIIKPLGDPEELAEQSLVTRIELVVIDWKDQNFDTQDRFDISNCYQQPGQYTWFQIVFSDTLQNMEQYEARETDVRIQFESTISGIIPKLRLPEIRVTFLDTNLYITGKLLERPALQFSYYVSPNTALMNPSKVLVFDREEDCIQYCLEENCQALTFCDNMICQISSRNGPSDVQTQAGCNYYSEPPSSDSQSRQKDIDQVEKSSKALLYKLKEIIERGDLVLGIYSISAEDLFIVNGPDQIGGIDDEFGNDRQDLPSGNDYTLIDADHRLIEGTKTLGITYQQCLVECDSYDDCYFLSYCASTRNQECMIFHSNTQNGLSTSSKFKDLTTISESCDVFMRKSSNFFTKFPGRSLVVSAKSHVENVNFEQCAQLCQTEKSFTCQSFDFCPEPFNRIDQKVESACFLHEFHVARDLEILDGTIWNFNGTGCDHYARKYSQDYQEYLGRRLNVGGNDIIDQLDGILLENCAMSCNSAQEPCNSFEFCEATPKDSVNTLMTSCRISKFRPNRGVQGLQSTVNRCSVYVSRISRSQSREESSLSLGLAFGLGSFAFILAFAGGLIGSQFYLKRRIFA